MKLYNMYVKEPRYITFYKELYNRFLEDAHTKPEEVKKDGYHNKYFYLDGYRIDIPDHLMNARRFKLFLKKENVDTI